MISSKQILSILSVSFLLPVSALAAGSNSQIPTVGNVELASYLGLWYEQRRIPNDFQDNEKVKGDGPCFNTTAEYSQLPEGKLGVKNTCYRVSGSEVAVAKGRVVEGSNNAKLKVNFTGNPLLEWLGIGDGDYWILGLGDKNADGLYSWVLVGSPDLKFGWVLSRTPVLGDSELEAALSVADSVGYDRNLFLTFLR